MQFTISSLQVYFFRGKTKSTSQRIRFPKIGTVKCSADEKNIKMQIVSDFCLQINKQWPAVEPRGRGRYGRLLCRDTGIHVAIYIPAEIIRALNLSGGGRLRPCYGGRRRPSQRRLVEVIWPWAIKEACSFEVSRSLPPTAAATQLVHRKTGSRRWRSNSLITVALVFFVCLFFIFMFFFWNVFRSFFYPGVSGHHRGERRLDQKLNLRLKKKKKQNVPHHAKLECRSRTEKVLSYVKFTLYTHFIYSRCLEKKKVKKKHRENQRSHVLYNPSLRFSHRCARAALETNASCDVTKGSFSAPHTPTRPTLLDSCPLPNMCNKVQRVAAFTEGCKQRAKYAVFQRSIELQAKGNDNNNDKNPKEHGT